MKLPKIKVKTHKKPPKISVVDRDLKRKRQIERNIEEHKEYLMQFVAPSNRSLFGLMFDNWIKVPPWEEPTIESKAKRRKVTDELMERADMFSKATGINVTSKGIGTNEPYKADVKESKMKPCPRCMSSKSYNTGYARPYTVVFQDLLPKQ